MGELVQIKNNELLTNTLVIAKGMELNHRAVMSLVNKYSDRLEGRGVLTFEMSKPIKGENNGRPVKYAIVNESQFLFLATLMRNSEKVLDFKDQLTKEFVRQRKMIARLLSQRQNAEWIEKREQGKLARRAETDVIQKFVEYAKKQGSVHADKYYTLLSSMENKALFVITEKFPNLRNILDGMQLSIIASADIAVSRALKEGMEQGLPYRDIYQLAKDRLEQFSEIVGKTLVPSEKRAVEISTPSTKGEGVLLKSDKHAK